MCGIVGVYAPHDPSLMDPELLQRMTAKLAHRGPDDRSMLRQPGLSLGFCRLSIVDPDGGAQPIRNEDGSIVMVCNGEIYNHRELRRRLLEKGHRFRAQVDVEVLVHLYEEYGPEFLKQLNGQFAIALYDSVRRRLLLARDPVGIAPLFYSQCQDSFLFSSEIKALLEHPLVDRKVDLTGLDQVLTFPGPVSPQTLFAGIRSLPPGAYVLLGEESSQPRTYWDLDYPVQSDLQPAPPDLEELDARLRQAVAYRLQADVEVGSYLSGGLDSSLIAALIREIDHSTGRKERRHTFSIGFADENLDERSFQEQVARQVGSQHHTRVFTPQQVYERLRQAVLHAEAPLKESYNTCSLALSALVRDHRLKVVLTGEGADELFGGYVGYRLDLQRRNGGFEDHGLEAELERDLRGRMWGDSSFFYEKDYVAFRDVKTALYSSALAQEMTAFDSCLRPLVDHDKLRGRHPLHQRSYVDFKLRLADHLLADHGDRVSYAHSVEARYPFLDPMVIDWVRKTSPIWLVHQGREKYPLRQLASRYLSPEIAGREKFGFVAQSCAELLREDIEWINDLLSYENIKRAGYFNPDTIERLKARYRKDGFSVNATFDTDLLMIVLSFEICRESFGLPAV